jgi:UDP-N-acetylmuramoylalanine--D-glutamate ligase
MSPPIVSSLEAGIPVWSEIELAWRQLDVPVIAVTATNGKTTVTQAAADMLAASGMRTAAAGNIGTAPSDMVGGKHEVLVVEVSSFQLRFTDQFHPQVAVLLNLAPDHLDWHGSYGAYADAKSRILANQGPDDLLIYDLDDAGVQPVVKGAKSRHHPVSLSCRPQGGSGIEGGTIHLPGMKLVASEIPIKNPTLLIDLMAAAVAALDRGADPAAVERVFNNFGPAPHRRAKVGELHGVEFIDDSKATNPHAAMAAIGAYTSVILIAGGLAKGLDLSPLAGAANVRLVIGIGTAGPVLVAEAGNGRGRLAASMEEAVAFAVERARPGDTVLLAPGCASYDMFENYAARGEAFRSAVEALIKGGRA